MQAHMSAQNDFNLTVDSAAGLVLEATCRARAAGHGSLPHPHRRLLNSAISSLERAQQALFQARNDPWQSQTPKPKQLSLGV